MVTYSKKKKTKLKKKKCFFSNKFLNFLVELKKKLKAKHFFFIFFKFGQNCRILCFSIFSIFYKIVETVQKKQLSPSSKIMTSIFVSAISENHNLFFCHIIIIPRSHNYSSTIHFSLISMKLYFK